MAYKNIIIVGENNVCNSFMCGVILRGLLKGRGISDIEIVSRGLVVLFSEPVAPLAASVLTAHDYVIEDFRSAQLTREDVDRADLILTQTDDQAQRVKLEYPLHAPCLSLGSFIKRPVTGPNLAEGTREDYEEGFRFFESLMEAVAERMTGESMV